MSDKAPAKCPMCGRPVPETGAAPPFCSPRCRMLDLGNWLGERYVIPAKLEDESASQDDGTGDGTGDLH